MGTGYYVADQNQICFFNESGTYGSQIGNAKWIGMVQEHQINESMGVIPARYVGSASRNVSQFLDGPKTFNNTLTYFPQDWQFLYYALGKVTDAGSPSPFLHTITEANGNNEDPTNGEILPSFQVEDFQGTGTAGSNFLRTFKGNMINSLTLTIPEGEPASVEMNYFAQDVTYGSGAKTSVTADTARPFMWSDFKLHMPSGTLLSQSKNISLTINNNLIAPQYVDNDRVIGVPIPGMRDYTLNVTLNSVASLNKAFYDQYFVGGSTFNALLAGVASTGSRQVFITMSGCKLDPMSAPTVLTGPNEHVLTIYPQSVSVLSDDLTQYWRAFSGA